MGACLLILSFVFFAQVNPAVDGPVLSVPGPSSSTTTGQTTVNNTTTNVYPAPSQELMVSTETQAAPVILGSSLRALNKSAASPLHDLFAMVDSLDHVRQDVIFSDTVKAINENMGRVVLQLVAVVIAAICIFGLFGQMFGLSGNEIWEMLGGVPLWGILAMSTWSWYKMLMDLFTAIALAITQAADGSFGRVIDGPFWDDVGLGLFALFVGVFLLLSILMFVLQLFANTAFLAFALAVAPAFVFAKSNRWTEQWGNNWFRMVPGTAMDLVAMVAVITIGGVAMQRISHDNAGTQIFFLIGILLALPLIRRLFGLEHSSPGARLFGAFALGRMIRARGNARPPLPAPDATPAAAAAPTRAPRWNVINSGHAVTRKTYQQGLATRRLIMTP